MTLIRRFWQEVTALRGLVSECAEASSGLAGTAEIEGQLSACLNEIVCMLDANKAAFVQCGASLAQRDSELCAVEAELRSRAAALAEAAGCSEAAEAERTRADAAEAAAAQALSAQAEAQTAAELLIRMTCGAVDEAFAILSAGAQDLPEKAAASEVPTRAQLLSALSRLRLAAVAAAEQRAAATAREHALSVVSAVSDAVAVAVNASVLSEAECELVRARSALAAALADAAQLRSDLDAERLVGASPHEVDALNSQLTLERHRAEQRQQQCTALQAELTSARAERDRLSASLHCEEHSSVLTGSSEHFAQAAEWAALAHFALMELRSLTDEPTADLAALSIGDCRDALQASIDVTQMHFEQKAATNGALSTVRCHSLVRFALPRPRNAAPRPLAQWPRCLPCVRSYPRARLFTIVHRACRSARLGGTGTSAARHWPGWPTRRRWHGAIRCTAYREYSERCGCRAVLVQTQLSNSSFV